MEAVRRVNTMVDEMASFMVGSNVVVESAFVSAMVSVGQSYGTYLSLSHYVISEPPRREVMREGVVCQSTNYCNVFPIHTESHKQIVRSNPLSIPIESLNYGYIEQN